MSSNNGTNRIFDQAMKSSASNPDLRGSSKAAAGRSGSNGSGTVKDLSSMRGENSLESLPPTTFGANRGAKSRNDDQGRVSTPNADASGSSWSRRSDQPASAASGSRTRVATNSKNEVTWAGDAVPIPKPMAPKPSHYGSGYSQRSSAVASPYTLGRDTLNKKKPVASSPQVNSNRPPAQHRNGAGVFSKLPAVVVDPQWGMGRGESLRVNGQDWLNDLDSMSGPSPSRQGPNHSEPRPSGSTSHRQSQASSSRLSTSHGTTSAASKSTKPVSLDQQVEVTVSSSDSEDAPLKPPPPPKNATAGPSNPKRTSTGAGIIDRHKAKRHEVERPLPPPTRTKPSQEVLSISSDEEDDIQEFTTEEVATMHSTSGRQATIVGGQPGPSPAPSRRQPRPRSPSIPEAGPSQSKHPSPMDQYSVQTSRPPLPSFKKKEKAQLKGETDDDDAPAPAASTSTTGAVKRKVTDQPLPMRPVAGMMGGLTKKMKGKEGQMIVSPSGKPKSTSTSSTRKAPVPRGEPGHKTFPVHEWWKGFSKQSSRTNLQIGGGMFKIGAGKNDGELSLPFPQILRMRVSSQEPFLVSLELSDDGDRDKIISPAQSTTKHDYAKKCITFYFSPHKSDELLTFLHHEFSLDRTSIVYIEIDQDESDLLYDVLRKSSKPKPRAVTSATHPFSASSASVPSGPSTRHTTRSSTGAATVHDIDGSDDEPELVVPRPKARPPRPPCVNPTEVMATWPLTGKGQFDITKGDYHRTLDDVEFLNDTMIEYGLRSALAEAIKTMPELADDVHIFSTFLYTKLSNKKKAKDGGDPWEVVARWTRKFDIFSKKFLIVPINEDFHWYLAIIVNPGAVLRPPEVKIPPEPTTTTRSRNSSGGSHIDVDAPPSSHSSPGSPPGELQPENAEAGPSNSRPDKEIEEVEQALTTSNERSPRDDDDVGERVDRPVQRQLDDVHMQEVEGNVRNLSLERTAAGDDDVEMKESNGEEPRQTGSDEKPIDSTAPLDSSTQPSAEKSATTSSEHGYIFTLDSLGSAHPAAGKLLNRYLASEARDRKKLPFEPTPLATKKLDVPTQPDYSSCGVYMIHYVECLFRDPGGVVAFGGLDSRSRLVAQKRDVLWRKSELPDARKRLKESVDGLVEAWKLKRLEEGSSSDQAKPPVVGEAVGSVAPKPSEEQSLGVAPEPQPPQSQPQPQPQPQLQLQPSTSISTSATAPPRNDQEQAQEQEPPSQPFDKGKGREVPLSMDGYQVASSSTKGPNPFGKSTETPTRSPNPFGRDPAPVVQAPVVVPSNGSAPFHFGANPPPSQPIAPPPPPQPLPSPPASQSYAESQERKLLDEEPVDEEYDEIDSSESESEDHRPPQERKLDQEEGAVEDFPHGQLEARAKDRDKELERLSVRNSSSNASNTTDPPIQPVSRPPSPPPLPPLPPIDDQASSSHLPPPTFRGVAPTVSQHLEPPRSRSSSRRNSPSVPSSKSKSRYPLPQPEVPTSQANFIPSSPPPGIIIPPSGQVSRTTSAPSGPSRPKEELAPRSSSDVYVDAPPRQNGNGVPQAATSRSSGKRSAGSNQDLQPPPSKKPNLDDSQEDGRTYTEKFEDQDPLASANPPQTPRPSSQPSKTTKKGGGASSNALEVGGSRKGSNNSSNGSKPSSQQSRVTPLSQTSISMEAQPSHSNDDDDEQEDDPLHLGDGPSTSPYFAPSQPTSKRKLGQESIPEETRVDEGVESDTLKSTNKKRKTKKEVEKEKREESKKREEEDKQRTEKRKEEATRKAKEDEIDLTED